MTAPKYMYVEIYSKLGYGRYLSLGSPRLDYKFQYTYFYTMYLTGKLWPFWHFPDVLLMKVGES